MSTTHDLKCWRSQFIALVIGAKTFEFRKNDRNYQVGDKLVLREWLPTKEQYTGAAVERKVSYILFEGFGLPEGYVVLALEPPCDVPPAGWSCSRAKGHDGPCAATPLVIEADDDSASLDTTESEARPFA